ncbi:MAG: Outer membrane protein assembly factor BamA precursor [Planctomycetes bacterium ADurb.Bin412]|nr:MAG: Outer membrane protein assembly factor BamA precursor [Planctomycetes bacterium ADurb.Bin412]
MRNRNKRNGSSRWTIGQRRFRIRCPGFCLVLLFLWLGLSARAQEPAPAEPAEPGVRIRQVTIEGSEKVPVSTIINNVRSRSGAVYDEKLVGEDARRILLMPQIRDVKWKMVREGDQVDLIFTVQETTPIASVTFLGNKKLKEKNLRKKIDFKAGDFLDSYLVHQGAESLVKFYQEKGYYYATVTVDEDQLQKENKVVYVIVEGPRLRIKKVKYQGNDSLPARKLNSKIKTKSYFPIFIKGRLDDAQLKQDEYALAGYYHDKGFLDARVFSTVEFNEEKTRATVTFIVEEGPRYRVSEIRFQGNENFTHDKLIDEIKMEPGDFYTKDNRTLTERSVKNTYGRDGYIYTHVNIETEYTEQEGQAIAVVEIVENGKYDLGRVVVQGNHQTQDKVIRRDFDHFGFLPGGIYNTEAMDKGKKRLESRGYFESITIQPIGDEPTSRDALVEVKEGRTGLILFGVGVDTNSGVLGQISVEQRNFDIGKWPATLSELFGGDSLIGAGQRMRLDFEPGTEMTRARLRFHEPYLLDQPYYLDTSLFLFRRWRESYLERRLGGIVSLGRRFDNDWSAEIGFRVEEVRVTDLDTDRVIVRDPNGVEIDRYREVVAPKDVQDVEGSNFLTSIKFGIGRDTTDNLFRPSEGYRFNISWEQYGAMGGDFTFGAASSGITGYHTIYEDITERKTVLAGQIRGSQIVGDAPVFERYYAGGIGSLRGFDYRGVSPRDGKHRDPIGSETLVLIGTELTHPLYEEVLFGKVFCDTGTVTEGPYRVTVGFGFELVIPQLFQMVPMNFDFGFPIYFDDEDDKEIFSFSFGVTF